MRVRDVLVPTDFSPASIEAAEVAARMVNAEGDVFLLHVIDERFLSRVEAAGLGNRAAVIEKLRDEARSRLDEIIRARSCKFPRFTPLVAVGVPFAEILKLARELDFEMIVLAAHGRGDDVESLLFGSTAEKVLRGAAIPVLCVPTKVHASV